MKRSSNRVIDHKLIKICSVCFVPFCRRIDTTAIEMVLENNENHLADEIDKVKDRLKTISSSLENQQTFLRLIIHVRNVFYLYTHTYIFGMFFRSIIFFIISSENGNKNRRRRSGRGRVTERDSVHDQPQRKMVVAEGQVQTQIVVQFFKMLH